MHIFVERHSLNISDPLATNTIFLRNMTECQQKMSQRGHKIVVLSERNLGIICGSCYPTVNVPTIAFSIWVFQNEWKIVFLVKFY